MELKQNPHPSPLSFLLTVWLVSASVITCMMVGFTWNDMPLEVGKPQEGIRYDNT